MDQEIIVVNELKHTFRYYWLIALVAILGGAVGFGFRYINPPAYESKATLHVMVDFTNTQLNKPESSAARINEEDLALQTIQSAFVETIPQVISYAQNSNLPDVARDFNNNYSIERMLAFWNIRFRYKDPRVAQKILAYWVQQSIALMQAKSKSGVIKSFISYEVVSNASLPTRPAYDQTNILVLAGTLIGLVLGIIAVRIPGLMAENRREGMDTHLAQPLRRYPLITWIVEILWALMLIGLPLTSLPLLGDITKSVVVPFSMIPLFALLLIWFFPYLLRRGGIPLESKPLIVFVMVVIVASAVTYFLAPISFKNKTIQSQEFRSFITLAIGLSFYFTIASWPTDQPKLKRALQLINIGGAVMIVWALFQAYYIVFHGINYPRLFALIRDHLVVQNSAVRDGNRVTGLAYEPSWFAHLLNVLYFPLWLGASYLRTSVFRWRLFKIFSFENILILPSLVVFILSSPRVGMAAFLLILVFLLIKLNLAIYRIVIKWITGRLGAGRIRVNLIKGLIRVGIVIVFIGVYVGGIFLFVKLFSKYDYRYKMLTVPFTQQELKGLTLNEPSLIYIGNRFGFAERLVYWFAGWHTFNDYPWIGVGLGNSGYYFVSHLSPQGWGLFEIRDVIYRLYDLPNIKSLWIRLLAETGVVGFSFFAVWYYLLWQSARATSRSKDMTLKLVALAGQLGLVAFLIEGFSVDSFALPFLWVITALIAASGALYRKEVLANPKE